MLIIMIIKSILLLLNINITMYPNPGKKAWHSLIASSKPITSPFQPRLSENRATQRNLGKKTTKNSKAISQGGEETTETLRSRHRGPSRHSSWYQEGV